MLQFFALCANLDISHPIQINICWSDIYKSDSPEAIYLRVGVIRSFYYYPTAVDNIDGNTPARKLAVCVLVVYALIKQSDKQVGNGEPQKK